MAARMDMDIHTTITTEPLDLMWAHQSITHEQCGAIAIFTGLVRNHDGGESVNSIDYSVHPSADDILRQIAEQFLARHGVHRIIAHHRVGHLKVGEMALMVLVAAEHRGQAISATEGIVEDIKARLPIWKKQHFSDGHHSWTGMP